VTKSLLDTDIFSEVLKNKNPIVTLRATEYRKQYGHYSISSPTITEIVTGYQQAERFSQLIAFRQAIIKAEILPFGSEEADLAGQIIGDLLRTGQPIGAIDPMVAATAITNALTLVTGNIAHFERVQQLGYHLLLENWRDG
jgi:tRNA(fMet)-specific endonuclease VapC